MSDPVMLIFAVVALVAGGWVWRRWKSNDTSPQASEEQVQDPS